MSVRFPQPLVISEYFNYDQFGEVVLALPLDGETRPFTGTAIEEPGAAANARTLANNLRRITLDDAQSAQNPATLRHPNGAPFSLSNRFRGGDTVQDAVGVLGFDFSQYRIIPTGPATYTAVNPRPAAPDPVGGDIRVAAMNTLNFFVTLDGMDDPSSPDNPIDNVCGGNANLDCRGADLSQPLEFDRQRNKLLAALTGLDADVIGLNELENTPGVEPLESITNGMSGYAYVDTGTIGTDAIKVGLIYRPAVVTPVGAFQTLDSGDDPRFIDTRSRPSLAQTFEVNATGARFTVVVNHLKSKGSACGTGDPDAGDGQGNCNGTRTQAAEALVDWIATDPTGSGDPDFLIMGDLNSYAMEDPIDAIKAGSDDTSGHRGRLHQPDRRVRGPVRLLVHVRRPGRVSRSRPRQLDDRRPGDRGGRVAHQLRRARRARLRHELQAASAGGVVRARPVPDVGSRRRRGRSRPHPRVTGRRRRRLHHRGGHPARGERTGSPGERQRPRRAAAHGRARQRSGTRHADVECRWIVLLRAGAELLRRRQLHLYGEATASCRAAP